MALFPAGGSCSVRTGAFPFPCHLFLSHLRVCLRGDVQTGEGRQFSVATDLEGNPHYVKIYWVGWSVRERSAAIIHYKAGRDLFSCAASCSHTLAHCFRVFVLFISHCLREFLARH